MATGGRGAGEAVLTSRALCDIVGLSGSGTG